MLFSDYKLKNLELRNRIVMAPMTRCMSPNNIPGKDVAKYYERRDKGEVGLIAEDVEKVIPELVKRNANGKAESIYYTKLGAYLIEAIKTIKDEIDNLKR